MSSVNYIDNHSNKEACNNNHNNNSDNNTIRTQQENIEYNGIIEPMEEDNNLITTGNQGGRYSIDGSLINRKGQKFNTRRKNTNNNNGSSVVKTGIDFIKKIKWKSTLKNNDNHTSGRRLSTADIDGFVDDTMDWKSSWSTQNTPRASIDENMPERPMMISSTSTHTIGDTTSKLLAPIHEHSRHYASKLNRALHTPSRFLPQHQAVLTTNVDGKILLLNDIASLCFSIDKSFIGKSIVNTLLANPFSKQITTILLRRKNQSTTTNSNEQGLVLVCGTIIPIIKANGVKSVASLWLKEKKADNGENVYIWIFEEIYETSLSVYVDSECVIRRVLGTMIEIYGYKEEDIIGKPVNCLVPALSKEKRDDNLERIDRLKFFGSQSSKGIYFPVILNLNRHVAIGNDDLASFVVKITSLPTIEGCMTIDLSKGLITSLNPVPAKYLFGYSVNMIVEEKKCHYNDLLPHLNLLFKESLAKGYLSKELPIVYNQTCKKILQDKFGEHSEEAVIYVVHRDKSQFEIEIQLKYVQENVIDVYIKYDRIDAISKYEKRLKREDALCGNKLRRLSLEMKPSNMKIRQIISDNNDQGLLISPITEKNNTSIEKPQRPVIKPSRISSFGAVDEHRKLFPKSSFYNHVLDNLPPSPPPPTNNDIVTTTQTTNGKDHPLDDYVILDILGQGTYGMAKLAYRKDDPLKTKLVIKYIIKSKIIVDSWIRDRQIGLIPMEIHILRTLQKYPHRNCCRLVTSLEDDDYYFVVMELLGDGMDLFDYIEMNKNMKEDEIKRIFYQVACAVKHLHQHKIVHRDIKDENIILDQEGTVHLIDFGCATYYKKDRKFDTFTGTLEYCAPEVLKGKPYEGPPQDIWASGILLFTLIYRENPFYNIDEIMERELRVPFIVSKDSLNLIQSMLERDIEKRINIDQVLEHPWFHSLFTDTTTTN